MPITKRSIYAPKNQRLNLTRELLDGLQPTDRDYLVKDQKVSKLHVKVTPAGKKSFLLRYRNSQQKERKLKLGDYPDLSISAARRIASERLLEVNTGSDPAATKAASRAGQTFSEFSQKFMEEHVIPKLRPKTIQGYEQFLRRNIIPHIGNLKLSAVSYEDVLSVQRRSKSRPFQANRAVKLIGRIFNYAEQIGELPLGGNPARGITYFPEKRRERILSHEEMARIGVAIEQLEDERPAAAIAYRAIQALFLTGCRSSEMLNLRWTDVDFERETIHYRDTKSGARTVDMSGVLIDHLKCLSTQRFSDWVFPGRDPILPLTDLKKSWATILKRADVEGVRLHDVRRTVISDLANNYDLPTAQAAAGHKSLRATEIYVNQRSESIKRGISETAAGNASLVIRGQSWRSGR